MMLPVKILQVGKVGIDDRSRIFDEIRSTNLGNCDSHSFLLLI